MKTLEDLSCKGPANADKPGITKDSNELLVCCTRKQDLWLLFCFLYCQTLAIPFTFWNITFCMCQMMLRIPRQGFVGAQWDNVWESALQPAKCRGLFSNSGHHPGHSLFPFPVACCLSRFSQLMQANFNIICWQQIQRWSKAVRPVLRFS